MKNAMLREAIVGSPVTKARRSIANIYPHRYGSVMMSARGAQIESGGKLTHEDVGHLSRALRSGDWERAVKHVALATGPLTLTKASNLHNSPRARRGSRGLGPNARKLLQADAAILEELCRKGTVGFFTGTVPATEYDQLALVMTQWERVIKNFKQSLRHHLRPHGIPLTYVHCTEIQGRRYRQTGLPILHLHMAFRCRRTEKDDFYVTHDTVRTCWVNALNSVTTEQPFYNAITDLQVVRKSLVSYLSKYMSKGVSGLDEAVKHNDLRWTPKSWWGSSRDLKAARAAAMVTGRGELADRVYADIWDNPEACFDWVWPVQIDPGDGSQILLGFIFQCKPEYYASLRREYAADRGSPKLDTV